MRYTTKFLEKHQGLKIDDGRLARDIPLHELNRALVKMNVPGVDATTGKQNALDRLAEFRAKQEEAAEALLDHKRNPGSNKGAAA